MHNAQCTGKARQFTFRTIKQRHSFASRCQMIGDGDKRPNKLGTMNDVTLDSRPHAIMYSNHGWSKYVNHKYIKGV